MQRYSIEYTFCDTFEFPDEEPVTCEFEQSEVIDFGSWSDLQDFIRQLRDNGCTDIHATYLYEVDTDGEQV